MFLEIPIKLEGYVDQIKKQSQKLDGSDKLTLLRLGKTTTNTSDKLMYIMYNPYPTTFYVDANFFTKKSKIFKIYPDCFNIEPRSAIAFVAFVENVDEIAIDEKRIVNTFRESLDMRLLSLLEFSHNYKRKPEDLLKIESSEVTSSETMYINPDELLREIEEIQYHEKFQSDIEVVLDNINVEDRKVKFNIKFINTLYNKDVKISKYRIKIYDDIKKLYITVDEKFTIKHSSSKISTVNINKIEFDQIDIAKMNMKVTIM